MCKSRRAAGGCLLFLLLAALGFNAAATLTPLQLPDADAVAAAPLHVVAPGPLQKALAAPRKERPLQFAVPVSLPLTLGDGQWSAVEGGMRAWRLRIYSHEADSLSLHFSRLQLPDGASLWLYDPAGRVVQGPITARSLDPSGAFWTPLVPGDTLVVELQVPSDRVRAADLKVERVHHGFRSFDGTSEKSGSCNIDVVCPQGEPWRDEIRSVARITIGGIFACSGLLVNNMRQDDTPYFLTADHCGVGDPHGGSAESVVFYWNYQTSQCGGSPDGSLHQNQTGASFVADNVESDFTLMRLREKPSPLFTVYYSGWNVSGETPGSGVSIHHPSAQEKRISLYDRAPTRARADIGGGRIIDSWRVVWSQGTTEPGSSGAALWDQDRYAVGLLSGGNASCETPREPDYYARLERAWRAEQKAAGQLRAHLDPDDTGCVRLHGRDPREPVVPVDTSNCVPGRDGRDAPRESGAGLFLGAVSWSLIALALLAFVPRRRH